MKILFISLKYYDSNKILGYSYEYEHFYKFLKMYYNADHLSIDELIQEGGYAKLDVELNKIYKNYDFLFFFMYKDDFNLETLKKIKEYKKLKSICWFSDDDWRYEIYSRKYINCFNLILTTYPKAFSKYKEDGEKNVLLSQWAANPKNNLNIPNKKYLYDVSFVGKKYGNREPYIKFLAKKKYFVKCYGNGWDAGSYFDGDIRKIYNFSRINLNFSDSSTGLTFKNLVKVFFNKNTLNKYSFNNFKDLPQNFKNLILCKSKQIKARPFEILASQNFLLCEHVDELKDYFEIGKDLDTFSDKYELEEKVIFYLENLDLAEHIAINGKKKIEEIHNYQKRFEKIFNYFGK
jgi:spore maturation protein CgeB